MGQLFLGLVTILVATIVYRWQKNVDRETSIQSERRTAYAKYIAACKTHFFSQPFIGDEEQVDSIERFYRISDQEVEVYVLREQVYLLASEQVLTALNKQERSFRAWKISFPKMGEDDPEKIAAGKAASNAFLEAHKNLLGAMRLELSGHHAMRMPDLPLRRKIANWIARIT